jgi:hypothetical protein
MKLKIESDDAKIAPEMLDRIAKLKPKGFSLRIHSGKSLYRLEDLAAYFKHGGQSIFNVQLGSSLLMFEDTLLFIMRGKKG